MRYQLDPRHTRRFFNAYSPSHGQTGAGGPDMPAITSQQGRRSRRRQRLRRDPKGPDLIFGSRKTSPSIAPVVQESILPALHSHMPGQARHNVVRREDQPSHPDPIQRCQGLRVLAPTLCLAPADAVRTSSSGQSRSSHSADARRRPHLSTRRSRRESPIGRRLTDYFNGSTEPALGTHHVSRPPRPAIRPRSVAGWHSCP